MFKEEIVHLIKQKKVALREGNFIICIILKILLQFEDDRHCE